MIVLSGLEVILICHKELEKLEAFHRSTLRQTLTRTSHKGVSIYLLIGALPVETLLDTNN